MNKKVITIVSVVLIGIVGIISILFIKKNDAKIDNRNEKINMNEKETISPINIDINGMKYTATLEDNETTRKLIAMLPLEINMDELNGNEKYNYLSQSLPSNPVKIGSIRSGDLMLYGNDCLVLFYESFSSSYRYTRIGKIDNPSSLKKTVGEGSVRILLTR